MSKGELLVVDQAGATGPWNELFRRTIADPGLRMELGSVATAVDEHVGARLGDLDPGCPEVWADRRLLSLEDLAQGSDGSVVFSGLQEEPARQYEDRLARGRLVVSTATINRDRPDVPVANAFINPQHIDQLYATPGNGRIIAGGNSMATILATAAYPLYRELGMSGMVVETLQGWSGIGLAEVPADKDAISVIQEDERERLTTEPNMLLGESIDIPAEMRISVHPNRGPWLRGHHARVEARLGRVTTKHEVEDIWRQFEAPGIFKGLKHELKPLARVRPDDDSQSRVETANWPRRHQPIKPVRVRFGELVDYGDTSELIHRLASFHPMRVTAHLKEVSVSKPDKITFEVLGDNLMLGRVGVNLLNVIYARHQGYLS